MRRCGWWWRSGEAHRGIVILQLLLRIPIQHSHSIFAIVSIREMGSRTLTDPFARGEEVCEIGLRI